jgi:hypothetical protein
LALPTVDVHQDGALVGRRDDQRRHGDTATRRHGDPATRRPGDPATRDPRALTDVDLLDAIGERRGRYYQSSTPLREEWKRIRSHRPARGEDDPYELVAGQVEPQLPGMAP